VEIALAGTGAGVRDSKNRTAGALSFDSAEWCRFLGAAKHGEFDAN
jgi:hypothetical protein